MNQKPDASWDDDRLAQYWVNHYAKQGLSADGQGATAMLTLLNFKLNSILDELKQIRQNTEPPR